MPEPALDLPECVLKVEKVTYSWGRKKNKGGIREDKKEKGPPRLDVVRWVRFKAVEMASRA